MPSLTRGGWAAHETPVVSKPTSAKSDSADPRRKKADVRCASIGLRALNFTEARRYLRQFQRESALPLLRGDGSFCR